MNLLSILTDSPAPGPCRLRVRAGASPRRTPPMGGMQVRRLRSLATATLIASMVATGLTVLSAPGAAQAAVVWNDEFNGGSGQGVDSSKWSFDTGGGGFGNS